MSAFPQRAETMRPGAFIPRFAGRWERIDERCDGKLKRMAPAP